MGGEIIAGGKLKEIGTSCWNGPNTDATNISLFSGLPSGYRHGNGDYASIGGIGYWWSSTENSVDVVWYRYLHYTSGSVFRASSYRKVGFSVRCLKD